MLAVFIQLFSASPTKPARRPSPNHTSTSHTTASSTSSTAPRQSTRISEKKAQEITKSLLPPSEPLPIKKKSFNPFPELEADKKRHTKFKEANERWLRDLSDDDEDALENSSIDGAGPSTSSPSRGKRNAAAVQGINEGLGLAEPEVTKELLASDESLRNNKAGDVIGVPFWSTEETMEVTDTAMPEFMDQDSTLMDLARQGSAYYLKISLLAMNDSQPLRLQQSDDDAENALGHLFVFSCLAFQRRHKGSGRTFRPRILSFGGDLLAHVKESCFKHTLFGDLVCIRAV